ncbi:MAG: sodium:solute symporter family protein, partial [Bacteroidota bacterium]
LTEGAISVNQGTLITFLIIILFTSLAGMVSIVSIDIFNGVIMIIAICLAVPFAIDGFGGWDQVVQTINETNPNHLSVMEGHDPQWYIGIMLPTLILLLSESSVYQKFSSAKDASSARKAVMGMFIGVVFIEFMMCLLAVVGYAIYSSDPRFFMPDGSVNEPMSEEIILRIGFEKLPALIGSFLFAGGAAIILSTGNTFLMVTSTNFSRDIIEKYFIEGMTDKQKLLTQRLAIVILGFLAYLIMTQFEQILDMAFISYTMIGAALAPPLLATFFWKRVTKQGGVASILSGMLSVIVIEIFNRSGVEVDLGFISFPYDSKMIAIPALITSLLALIVVSYLTKPTPKEIVDPFFTKE